MEAFSNIGIAIVEMQRPARLSQPKVIRSIGHSGYTIRVKFLLNAISNQNYYYSGLMHAIPVQNESFASSYLPSSYQVALQGDLFRKIN